MRYIACDLQSLFHKANYAIIRYAINRIQLYFIE